MRPIFRLSLMLLALFLLVAPAMTFARGAARPISANWRTEKREYRPIAAELESAPVELRPGSMSP